MPVYRRDIQIVATAYVVAPNPERAKILFNSRMGTGYELRTDGDLVDGNTYDALEELAAPKGEMFTISPAITFQNGFIGQAMECVYEDDFPLEDWQFEVANGDTKLGYAEWKEGKMG